MTGETHADLLARAQHLVRERDAIEANIREFDAVLHSVNFSLTKSLTTTLLKTNIQQKVGMDDLLIDREGFPRADVDIYAVRHARTQIIRKHIQYM